SSSIIVTICCSRNGTGAHRVLLEIKDSGKGFDPVTLQDKGGMGLTSMRERAEKLGTTLELITSLGEGTTVKVDIELEVV
ncbi:MAG: hypothetical protein GWN86_17155, partial [Desulfobacterales bacterium]|nr:hypothetical protein [Desulfobacterales bacterium]